MAKVVGNVTTSRVLAFVLSNVTTNESTLMTHENTVYNFAKRYMHHQSANQSRWGLTTLGAHQSELREHSSTGWFVIGSRQCFQSRRRMRLDSVSILHVRAHRCG